jgi:hypothetical protein
MKIISATLILISSTASLYYLFVGWIKPEILIVYNKANIPPWGIQLWAFILGTSGLLLLFPQTFKLAGALMILNSLFTIGCFVAIKDLKGGCIEFLFLQIPIFLLWAGYPVKNTDWLFTICSFAK